MNELWLHNTLSSKKESFQSQDPNHVRLYVCGPTVYDHAHLGHARCYVIYDVFVRHLRALGKKVTYVRNITDIDDKIVARAKELNEPPAVLAQRFTDSFHHDMNALGNLAPELEPKVSEHLAEIVELIQKLIRQNAAYEREGDVYFRVRACASYGRLSGRHLEELCSGASGRVSDDELRKKENPADFALWKKSDAGEVGWPSPWGEGRPGWHIECSAMSMKYLGESFDLHGGGLDLVFPHHENERAQSEAATQKPYATHWMHNGFVEVDKQKMSKSLGNFFCIREALRFVDAEAVRYFMLTAHYRAPLSLDWSLDEQGQVLGFPQMAEAETRLEYMYTTVARLEHTTPEESSTSQATVPEAVQCFTKELQLALNDDFNTPVALAKVADFFSGINETLDHAQKKRTRVSAAWWACVQEGLQNLRAQLGLLEQPSEHFLSVLYERRAAQRGILVQEIETQINARVEARQNKDFGKADQIRKELVERGVELMDGPLGTRWRIAS